MSEEIKEILEQLKDSVDYPKFDMPTFDGTDSEFIDNDTLLEPDKCKLLLDYITNLQQKVEQLEKEVNEYQKELEKADSITQSCIFQGKQESKISFRNCLNRLEQLENIRKEAIGYVTSYESISTIQNLDDIEKNKNLDEKTMNEMINRYLKVHDILLNILNKGSDKK